MKVSAAVAERGHDYYQRNKVRYICVDGSRGYAIVEGSEAYEVEFSYRGGEISDLTCSCFCSYPCKHAFAAMLQLKETLEKSASTTRKNLHMPDILRLSARARCSTLQWSGKIMEALRCEVTPMIYGKLKETFSDGDFPEKIASQRG